MRKLMMAALILVAGVLAGCGATSTGANGDPIASSGSDMSSQEIVAVAEETFPQESQYQYYVVCGVDGNLTGCPYTDRLKARLRETGQTLGRAQNPSSTFTVRADVIGRDSGVAHVVMFQGRQAMDLIVIKTGGRVLVDDETCTGRAATSIYAPLVAC